MSSQQKSLFKKFLSLFMHLPDNELPNSKETHSISNKIKEQKAIANKQNTEQTKEPQQNIEKITTQEIAIDNTTVNSNTTNEISSANEAVSSNTTKEVNPPNDIVSDNVPKETNVINDIGLSKNKKIKRKKSQFAPIVTFNMVNKVFNEGTPNAFKALEDIDFEIDDIPDVGEFIALVGPSGCGKSTILNLIQGFQEVGPPTSGEILIRSKPVNSPGRDRGMIFQKYSSFPHLTVLENVMFGLELNAEGFQNSTTLMKKLALDMIEKVGMAGHEAKYPYQLSGGQQQRVAIARTLVLKPRIILMDEPFSALDEPTRIEMQSLITNLWNSIEATVFIVTHSLTEAIYLSDRIFMLSANPGKLQKIINITPEMIGKDPKLSPLEVQESDKFRAVLKEITEDFLRIGGQMHEIEK